MKRFCLIFLAVFMVVGMVGCSGKLSETELYNIAHDFAGMVTQADKQQFMKSYQNKITAAGLYPLLELEYPNTEASAIVRDTIWVYDTEQDVFCLYALVERSYGVNLEKLIKLHLNSAHTKISEVEVTNYFSYQYY